MGQGKSKKKTGAAFGLATPAPQPRIEEKEALGTGRRYEVFQGRGLLGARPAGLLVSIISLCLPGLGLESGPETYQRKPDARLTQPGILFWVLPATGEGRPIQDAMGRGLHPGCYGG